jgi:hypothetical protein
LDFREKILFDSLLPQFKAVCDLVSAVFILFFVVIVLIILGQGGEGFALSRECDSPMSRKVISYPYLANPFNVLGKT